MALVINFLMDNLIQLKKPSEPFHLKKTEVYFPGNKSL